MNKFKRSIDSLKRPAEHLKAIFSLGRGAVDRVMSESISQYHQVEDGAIEYIEEYNDIDAVDNFEIPHKHADQLITWVKNADNNPQLAQRAQQIHGQCYVGYGYFTEDALMEDRRLYPELDGTREKEGKNIEVTYLLAQSKHEHPSRPAESSLRMIDIAEGGTIECLPTYGYGDNSIYPGPKARLNNIVELYGKESVREVAALSTVSEKDHTGSYELMRSIVQNAIIKNESGSAKREVWIASLTRKSLGPVVQFVGKSAVETIGEATSIFTGDDRANKDLKVTPIMIDPSKIIDGIVDDIESADSPLVRQKLMQHLYFLTDGLDEAQIGKKATKVMKVLEMTQAS